MSRARKVETPSATLPEGVYEHLVTQELERRIAASAPLEAAFAPLDDAEAHISLARHIGREIERLLDSLPKQERAEQARAFSAKLVEHLVSLATAPELQTLLAEQRPTAPPRRLVALHRGTEPRRPYSPLATSSLLTRSHGEPPLGQELAAEIATSDNVDAIIAFVTVSGINAIREALHSLSRRGGSKFRLLTTTFRGVTELAALDEIARLPGAEVKVSFDVRRTRLHAKAWLFRRATGLTTAYIGSANLTSTALGAGHEWMVKVCAGDLAHVVAQFAGTFDTLWEDSEFVSYHPDDAEIRKQVVDSLSSQNDSTPNADRFLIALRALPFQEEILDRLTAERDLHGRRRNLVVAATGTGKTVIAALDYVRQFAKTGVAPRLLFLAHRKEIVEQALTTFRHAVQDWSFGELLVGSQKPSAWNHVFATIQSAASHDIVAKLGPEHFQHVVVDECHHMPAKTYQDVVPRLNPSILVGLTATPERADNQSLLADFDDHVAAELRLWHALNGQLLVPFEYYGISDGTDLRNVRWKRGAYDVAELADIYTGNTRRADLTYSQLVKRVADPRQVRALGFCISVAHAEFMAAHFTKRGIPARAVSGDSSDREAVREQLQNRTFNVIFTCDLYNEGVDLPFVDTLLLLRPTQSTTLFLQQLGRGLRHFPGKSVCLVLDFIGQHRSEFRFDGLLSALTSVPRARMRKAVEHGFPFLPSGCTLELDSVARDSILQSLRTTLAGARQLTKELRELSAEAGRPSLRAFLDQTGREVTDVYDAGGWSALQHEAGVLELTKGESLDETLELSRRFKQLCHIDEPERLTTYHDLLRRALSPSSAKLSDLERRRVMMLESQLHHRGILRAAEATLEDLQRRPAVVRELEELREVLDERVALAQNLRPVPEWSLTLHRHYSRREIVTAVGYVQAGDKSLNLQTGILKLKDAPRELLFITLDKSGSEFSPSTRYRDYAISPELFHWETQSNASVARESGRRYIESPANGREFYLFVRTDPEATFAFLGPATYQSHTGDRPIAITWRLLTPMPAALYERYATLRPT